MAPGSEPTASEPASGCAASDHGSSAGALAPVPPSLATTAGAAASASASGGETCEPPCNSAAACAADLPELAARDQFDWLVQYDAFRGLLRDWLAASGFGNRLGSLSALVLGCGSSSLSAKLVTDQICARVVSLDVSTDCISFMAKEHADDDRLAWKVCDITDMAALGAALGAERFDLIVDKATLDAVLCDRDPSGYLAGVFEYMACGGALIMVSLYPDELVRPLLTLPFARAFEYQSQSFEDSGPDPVPRTFATLRDLTDRCGDAAHCQCSRPSPTSEELREHFAATVNWYHTEHAPLLSPERKQRLRDEWGAGPRPSKEAFELMFSWVERQDYLIEDFVADLAPLPLAKSGELTLEEAFSFFLANQ